MVSEQIDEIFLLQLGTSYVVSYSSHQQPSCNLNYSYCINRDKDTVVISTNCPLPTNGDRDRDCAVGILTNYSLCIKKRDLRLVIDPQQCSHIIETIIYVVKTTCRWSEAFCFQKVILRYQSCVTKYNVLKTTHLADETPTDQNWIRQ